MSTDISAEDFLISRVIAGLLAFFLFTVTSTSSNNNKKKIMLEEAFFEDKVFTEQEFIISQKSQVLYPVGFVKCIWIFKTLRRPVEASIYKIRKT